MLQGEVIKQVVYLGFQVESLEDLWAIRYWSKEGVEMCVNEEMQGRGC